jgi:hypothetical protein
MTARDKIVFLAATPRVCPRCGSRSVRYPVSTHRREVRRAVEAKVTETEELTGAVVDAAGVLAASRGVSRIEHGGEVCEACLVRIISDLDPVVLVRWVWWRDNRGRLPVAIREGGFIPAGFSDSILRGRVSDEPYLSTLKLLRTELAVAAALTGLVLALGILGVVLGVVGGWVAGLLLSGLVTGGLVVSLWISREISRTLNDLREWHYYSGLEGKRTYPREVLG